MKYFVQTTLSLVLIATLVVVMSVPRELIAYDVIDATATTTITDSVIAGPNSVFTSDQVGYVFYVNDTGDAVYA